MSEGRVLLESDLEVDVRDIEFAPEPDSGSVIMDDLNHTAEFSLRLPGCDADGIRLALGVPAIGDTRQCRRWKRSRAGRRQAQRDLAEVIA